MPARRSGVTARRRGNLMRLLHGVYPERGHKRFLASLRMTKSEGLAMTLCVCQVIYDGHCNPSVSVVFIPLWQRGIKGDFKIMLVKSPLAPLFQRGVWGIRVHLYYLNP